MPWFARFPAFPPALLATAGLVALPELVLVLADLGVIGSTRWRVLAWQYGGFWVGLLHGWRPNFPAQPVTMFLTHAVLHVGPGHMIGNLGALLAIGPIVAGRFGPRGFLAICTGAALGGGAAFGLLSGSPSPMVGASGAIFGLVGAWTWMQGADRTRDAGPNAGPDSGPNAGPDSGPNAGPVPADAGPARVALRIAGIVAGLVLLNLVMWLLADGVLAWETHLGGYLAGLAVAACCAPDTRRPAA